MINSQGRVHKSLPGTILETNFWHELISLHHKLLPPLLPHYFSDGIFQITEIELFIQDF